MKEKRTRPVIVGCLTLLLLTTVLSLTVYGDVPQLINYQGYLTDADGYGVPDGTYSMTFSLYLSEGAVDAEWTETQTVEVTSGTYNVQLGSETAFPGSLFDDPLYLGVAIAPDLEMTPRQMLTSTPFAIRAEVADGVADGAVNTIHIMDDAVTGAKIDNGTVEALDLKDGAVLAEIANNDGSGSGLDSDMLDGHDTAYFATAATVAALQDQVTILQTQVNQLLTLLANVTRPDSDTIRFSDVNVQIVNGTGTTDGPVNGLGNLIVGYNELRGSGDDRTGSHNIVVGKEHNYSVFGGLVVGYKNTISNEYASVSGGYNNTASGYISSVSGGYQNTASGSHSSVTGGHQNTASGFNSSVSGGLGNTASGIRANVSGGWFNGASGDFSSVTGGRNNIASGESSFVGGGGGENADDGNEAFGHYSAILGGKQNIAGDPALSDHTVGLQSTVNGGRYNTASGNRSSVSGGSYNTASGPYSSVSGGDHNTASSLESSVSGGWGNTADGTHSSVSGGQNNIASGWSASVSGGSSNTASTDCASVSGGSANMASGNRSSVSGGYGRSVSGDYDWQAGALFQDD